jgi:ribosomal protein L37E
MDGKLTADQQAKAVSWLNTKNSNRCPSCGQRAFNVAEHFVAPPVFADGGLILGGSSYPVFMLVCTNCGLTQYYNAVLAGLLK